MLKTILRVVLGLVVIVVAVASGLMLKGGRGFSAVRDVPIRPFTAPSDSAAIARGRHLVEAIVKCAECHGADLGGVDPFADMGPVGYVTTPNLTRGQGGSIGRYDDATLARAIRHGIRADGTPLKIMPSAGYLRLSDPDLGAIVAYLRSVPAVDRTIGPSNVKPLGRILYAAGKLPVVEADHIDHRTEPATVAPAVTVEYGQYLAEIGGCIGCHGPGLSGGKIPGTPPEWKPATNITPEGLKGWTEEDFVLALRTGIRPNKTPIDTVMPWRSAGRMDSTEMAAMWAYLQSVPAKPYGSR